MNLYDATVPIFRKMLAQLDGWLVAATEFAKERGFSPDSFLSLKLAPDQWALLRQVLVSCDTAKLTCARMTGKEAPSYPDKEKTMAEVRKRIEVTREYLGTLSPDDFVDCEERQCSTHFMKPKWMRAGDYLDHFALPNFYFHYATSYALLRGAGLKLGKTDFYGELPLKD